MHRRAGTITGNQGDSPLQVPSISVAVPWVASVLAAAGVAVIGDAGDGQRSVALGLMLLGISVTASLTSAGDAVSPTRRTFAASAAFGAFSAATIAGIPSFGLALLPAAIAWGVGVATVEHPADAVQVGAAGMTIVRRCSNSGSSTSIGRCRRGIRRLR